MLLLHWNWCENRIDICIGKQVFPIDTFWKHAVAQDNSGMDDDKHVVAQDSSVIDADLKLTFVFNAVIILTFSEETEFKDALIMHVFDADIFWKHESIL